MELLQEHKKQTRHYIFSGALWLLSSILGSVALLAGRRLIISTIGRFFTAGSQTTGQDAYSLLNILVSFPLVFLAVAIIIGGFEYHLREARLGSEKSYWLFARTFAIESGFLLLATFL